MIFDLLEEICNLRNVCKIWNEILFAMLTTRNVCSYGLPKMMELLPRSVNDMFYACSAGNLDIVKYLHENRVNIASGDSYAIRAAIKYGHLNIVKYLHENGTDIAADDNRSIQMASAYGHLDIVKYLHENGNVNDTTGINSALEMAIENGHIDVVKYLLS